MRGCLEGETVCFHDVELGAPRTANLVSIAVVVTLTTLHVISIPVFARHADLVESTDAAALLAAEIDVVRD